MNCSDVTLRVEKNLSTSTETNSSTNSERLKKIFKCEKITNLFDGRHPYQFGKHTINSEIYDNISYEMRKDLSIKSRNTAWMPEISESPSLWKNWKSRCLQKYPKYFHNNTDAEIQKEQGNAQKNKVRVLKHFVVLESITQSL